MKTKVIIIGGKGTAVVIAEQIYDAQHKYGMDIEVLGFAFDDLAYCEGINGWPVLCGTKEVYEKYKDDESVKFVYALYRSDLIRERISLRDSYGIPTDRFLSFVHPTTYIAKSAVLGNGNIILANCVINSNAQLGNLNTLQTGTLVGHDTKLGDSNFFAAYSCIGSNIKIGSGNFSGLNCCVKNFVQMGNYNLIGQCANVVKDVEDSIVLVGNPAKPLVK